MGVTRPDVPEPVQTIIRAAERLPVAVPGVVAIGLVGSWARGEGRAGSDVDLVVLSREPANLLEALGWAAGFDPHAELVATRNFGALQERRLRLPDGLEVEIAVGRREWAATGPVDPGTAAVVAAGLIPLFDPEGLLASLVDVEVGEQRTAALAQIADQLTAKDLGHPLRVGIDGVCGAGKSRFAHDLAVVLARGPRPVVLLNSDGFHHVRQRRYRQGRDSARGYYDDGYDFAALADRVLRPLGPSGDRVYAVKVHDLDTDEEIRDATAVAPKDAVLLFDATFIQRGALRELWDEVIYLDADEHVAIRRGVARDASALGGSEAARAAYESRYMAACRTYLSEEDPRARASIVVEHSDPRAPVLLRPHTVGG